MCYQAGEEVVHEDLVGEEPLEGLPELGRRLLEDFRRVVAVDGVVQLFGLGQLDGVGVLLRKTLWEECQRKGEDQDQDPDDREAQPPGTNPSRLKH